MDLNYTFYIKATPEKLWHIITTPEGTQAIFYGAKIESSFQMGSPVQYIGPGRDGENTIHIYGKVLEFDPNIKFSLTSIVGDVYRGDSSEYASRITYTLKDMGQYSRLDVRHDQWKSEDPSYENTKNNWWLMLSNIKSLAETGTPLDIGVHT